MKHRHLRPLHTLRHLATRVWQATYDWLRANTFTPGWMPRRWRHPLMGYLFTILILFATFALDFLLTELPHFEFSDLLVMLAILCIALTWGAGPALFATILGNVLLYYVIFPPHFDLIWKNLVDLIQNGLVLFGGLFITWMISQRERQRRSASRRAQEAQAARQQAEALAVMLAIAHHRSEQEHQHVRRVADALLAMTEALIQAPDEAVTAAGFPPAAGVVTQRLAELTCQILNCQSLSIVFVDMETRALSLLAIVGASSEQEDGWQNNRHQEVHRRAWGDPTIVARLQAGETILLDLTQPIFQAESPLDRGHTLFLLPMQIGPRLIGLLLLEYDRPADSFADEELALAAVVAKLGAIVIERERLIRARAEAQANALALNEANRQMETFMGVASHELKTPLTSIILGLQMIQRRTQNLARQVTDGADDAQARYGRLLTTAETTLRLGERLNGLVNDLLDTSRIQAGRMVVKREPADLIAIVRTAVEEQRWMEPERIIHLHLPPQALVPICADAGRIGQVITNFLSNALRYSAEDRPVNIGVELEQQQARVWVRDQGPGLPPEEQARVWERFHRVPGIEVQSGSGVGMGIGLYISKTIVEQHQGQVGVQSAPGEGATFWVTLPLP